MNTTTQAELITANEYLIDLLRYNTSLDKSGIAQALKVTWPTISGHIERLAKADILIDPKAQDNTKENNYILLNKNAGHFIGISVGSAQIKITMVDMSFSLLSPDLFQPIMNNEEIFCEQKDYMNSRQKPNTSGAQKAQLQYLYCATPSDKSTLIATINNIFKSIQYMVEHQLLPNILGIGVAFTGVIDSAEKYIIKSYNLPFLENTPFADGILYRNYLDFFESHNITISLENNSVTAGIAEKCFLYKETTIRGEYNTNHKYCDKDNVITLYLDTGFGLGIIQEGKVSSRSNNLSGGIGHIEVPRFPTVGTPDGKCNEEDNVTSLATHCTCGSTNCLDYLVRTDVFHTNPEIFKSMSSLEIKEALSGETNADRELLGSYLGYVVNLLNNILNPELIIFSGKLYEVIDLLWESIQKKRSDNSLRYTKSNCALLKSNIGPLAPTIGAAIYAYYDKYNLEVKWSVKPL